jgi:6-phosphogluconolactonase (cycloisomerase 2 family)
MPQIMAMNERGDRLFVSVYAQGKLAMLDTSHPAKPSLLQIVDLGPGSRPHYIKLTEDGKRLIVTDYFLDEDDFGKVRFGGDRKVRMLNVHRNQMELDRGSSWTHRRRRAGSARAAPRCPRPAREVRGRS